MDVSQKPYNPSSSTCVLCPAQAANCIPFILQHVPPHPFDLAPQMGWGLVLREKAADEVLQRSKYGFNPPASSRGIYPAPPERFRRQILPASSQPATPLSRLLRNQRTARILLAWQTLPLSRLLPSQWAARFLRSRWMRLLVNAQQMLQIALPRSSLSTLRL